MSQDNPQTLDGSQKLLNQARNKSFWSVSRKLLIPVITLVVLGFTMLAGYNQYTALQKDRAQENQNLGELENAVQAKLNDLERLALALATETAGNPQIQATFAAGDREHLLEIALPNFELIKQEFAVKQLVFQSPPASPFLRVQSPDKFGDDVSAFRPTVIKANTENVAVQGLEIGRAGLGVRGVVPVNYQGKVVGSVDLGIDLGSDFLEEVKRQYGVDAQFLLDSKAAEIATFNGFVENVAGPTDTLLYQAGTLPSPIYADASVYPQVLAGESVISQLKFGGRDYALVSFPVKDFSGTTIGVVELVSDRTDLVAAENRDLRNTILSTLLLIAVGSLILFQIINYTLTPVTMLTEAASAIADGDLNRKVAVTSKDEFGILSEAFNTMTARLRESITSLEQNVEARTKDLKTVSEISSATATILDPGRLLQEVVDLSKERFNLYHSHIYLLDEQGENLILTSGAGEPGRKMVAEGRSIPLNNARSVVARVAREKKGVTVNDVTQAPDFLPNPLLPDTHAELAVPMMVGDNVLGVFDVQSEVVGRFTEADVDVQTTLAAQIATSIQNVRSFEQSKKHADLEALTNTIGQRIRQAATVEETLQIALRELGTATGATRTKVMLGTKPNGASGHSNEN